MSSYRTPSSPKKITPGAQKRASRIVRDDLSESSGDSDFDYGYAYGSPHSHSKVLNLCIGSSPSSSPIDIEIHKTIIHRRDSIVTISPKKRKRLSDDLYPTLLATTPNKSLMKKCRFDD